MQLDCLGLFIGDKIALDKSGRPIISTNAQELHKIALIRTVNASLPKTVRKIQVNWTDDSKDVVIAVHPQNHIPLQEEPKDAG